jgi:uncharacterized repeat protein (TIGR01451 family)
VKWFIGALVLLGAALILQSGLLAYAMYVLLGVLLLSRFLTRTWVENLQVTRRCDRNTAEVGDSVTVTVTIRNAGPLPVPWVLVEDVVPAAPGILGKLRLKVRKKRLKIAMLGIAGQTELEYRLEFKMRGYYQIGPLVLESGDLFGLHRRFRVGTAPHFVLVYPRVLRLENYDIASRRPIGELRLSHRLFEDPTRIAGVRAYEPGDPLNRIHWRATACTGQLHCKVFEPSCLAGATIVLDLHRASYHAQGEPYRSDLAVTAAATLAHAVYQMGQQIGLVTNGQDAAERIRLEGWAHDYRTRRAALDSAGAQDDEERLRPLIVETRRGVEQFRRILETLARAELSDGLRFSELVTETASRLPRDASVVAILADAPVDTVLALGELRRHGYAVSAVLVMFTEEERTRAQGRLMAQGIEVRHFNDDASLTPLCQQQLLGTIHV